MMRWQYDRPEANTAAALFLVNMCTLLGSSFIQLAAPFQRNRSCQLSST
jgi:hypothetical protein